MDTPVRNPTEKAHFFSLLTFSWMNNILKLGSRQPLEEKHLLSVESSFQAERLVTDLEREWLAEERASEQNRTKPRLWRAMMKVITYRDYVTVAFFRMLYAIALHLFPLIIWFFLKSLSSSSEINYKATLPFVIGMPFVAFTRTLCSIHGRFKAEMIATKLKVATIGLVYKKASIVHVFLKKVPGKHRNRLYIFEQSGIFVTNLMLFQLAHKSSCKSRTRSKENVHQIMFSGECELEECLLHFLRLQ